MSTVTVASSELLTVGDVVTINDPSFCSDRLWIIVEAGERIRLRPLYRQTTGQELAAQVLRRAEGKFAW